MGGAAGCRRVRVIMRAGSGLGGEVLTFIWDLTDAQWVVIASLLPVPLCQMPLGGRPEKHHRRAVMDTILYLADNGIKWRAMPADFPPWRMVEPARRGMRFGDGNVPVPWNPWPATLNPC